MTDETASEHGLSVVEILATLVHFRKRILVSTLACSTAALALSFAFHERYKSSFTMLPPAQQQGLAAALLGSLTGGLSSAASSLGGLKNPADQWVSFFDSRYVTDRLIDKFDLVNRYDVKFRFEAALQLTKQTDVVAGKDGIISVAVTAESPQVAKAMAEEYVRAISDLNDRMALTEAARRRVFFEKEVQHATGALADAQAALARSGVPVDAIKTDPGTAVSVVADIKAQVAAAEVRLSVARARLADTSPEVMELKKTVDALQAQLARMEAKETKDSSAGYINAFREFKYRESVYEMLSKQLELAKLDEAREGSTLQIIDTPDLPEWKSSPKRSIFMALGAALGLFGSIASVFLRNVIQSVRAINRSQEV